LIAEFSISGWITIIKVFIKLRMFVSTKIRAVTLISVN
jgi:hypothetical protein